MRSCRAPWPTCCDPCCDTSEAHLRTAGGVVASAGMKSHFSRRLLPVVLLLLTAATARAQPSPAAFPDLDAFIQRVMKSFDVPGVSVAVVKDDAVVVARGFGVRKMGEPALVDEKTRFGIAS